MSLRSTLWRNRHFYLFISPFFILFAVFGLYPLLFSLYLSFNRWDGLTPMKWVGLANFAALREDDLFVKAIWNTIVIGLLYVPIMMVIGFLFAQTLNQPWLKLKAFFRTAYFLPAVTPMVVISFVFGLLFSSEKGVLNYGLKQLHASPIPWLNSPDWSKIAIALLVMWRWTGYNMVLMLAGLQGIPIEYYEAAAIDGASGRQRMTHITLPLMRPTFVFCMILSLLGTVYMFDEVFVLTRGGPGSSSTNFGLYLFNTSFVDFRFGYASCMAYTVAACVFIITLLTQRLNRDTE